VNFTVEYESRFEALKRLAELVNAEWWVDAEGKLHFKRERGQDRSAQVKLKAGENLLTLHSKPLETVNAVLASTVNFDLGDTVDVVDEELGLDSHFKVKRLIFEFDAEEGETLTVELGYLLPDLKDEILRTRVLERWLK